MTLKAAIFDMDGVVVDTVPIHFNAWKRMFSDYGHAFTFDEYKAKVDGIPRIDGARAILTNLSNDSLVKAGDKKQAYFLEEINKSKIPTYQSTIDLIDEFQKNGIKVAVISSSKNAPLIIKRIGLADKLDALISGFDITKGKPDPQIFLIAAKKLDAETDECIVFEDAVLGVEAAKNGKMKCIGIDRYNDPGRLNKADIVVSDLSEVDLDMVMKLF